MTRAPSLGAASLFLVLIWSAASAATGAHFELSRSLPEAYATVDSVSEIRLWFTEIPVEGTVSVRVVKGRSVPVSIGPIVPDARNPRVVSAGLRERLTPGTYTVSWRGRGTDGHDADGYFTFSLADSAGEVSR